LVVAVVTPPANVPLAPVVAGAVNVTVAPLTGDVPNITVACRFVENCVLTVALCGVPPVATIVSTGGGGAELELQPVQKTKAKQIKARMLA